MATSLRHVGIVVSDLERALTFYEGLLGLAVIRAMDESGSFLDAILAMDRAKVRTVKLAGTDNAVQVELLAFSNPGVVDADRDVGLTTRGPTHIALTVTDLENMYLRMVAAGISFTCAPRVSDDGKALVTFCRDPDGSYVELVELLEQPR